MKKYENFKAALKNLKDIYGYEEPYNNVVLTGLAALYEICFEQSWKAMKELLVNEGVSEAATGSPKSILKAAYKAGMMNSCGWKLLPLATMWRTLITAPLPCK